MYIEVSSVDHDRLLQKCTDEKAALSSRRRVEKAREMQLNRFADGKLNAHMSNDDIMQQASLEPNAKELLDKAGRQLHISARSYIRIVKVGRTIADLARCSTITSEHISEALRYRSLPKQYSN